MNYRKIVLWSLALCLVCNSVSLGQSGSRRRRPRRAGKNEDSVVSKAIAESKKTGLPIFAVSTAKTCQACASLLNTMAMDETLQPTLKQFVYLQIDVQDPEFLRWNRMYPRESNATPAWHVVTSKGKQVESGMGAPSGAELNQVLLTSLEKSGRLPSGETLERLVAAAEAAERHLKAGRESEALAAMMPVREEYAQFVGSLPMSDGGRYVMQIGERLAEQGHKKVDSLAKRSAQEGGWQVALEIAQTRQAYGMLPALQQELAAVEEEFTRAKTNNKLYRAALDLLRAEAMVAAGSNAKKTKVALTRVITRYPNTEAATAAARLLTSGKKLTSAKTVASQADETIREWTDSTGKYTIRASLVSVEGEIVRLKRADGKVMSVPIAKLDKAAQHRLAEQGKK